jgi:hypothetical protein
LRFSDSGSPETDAATHKNARLDPAAAVVPDIVGNNPHTAEAVCRESPEKLVNKLPMIYASSDDVFNESPTANAGRQEESKLATCSSFDFAPGSCYGAYCIRPVHDGVVLGKNTINHRSDGKEPSRPLSVS